MKLVLRRWRRPGAPSPIVANTRSGSFAAVAWTATRGAGRFAAHTLARGEGWMSITRQQFLRIAVASSALAATAPLRAQEGTLRIVVGYPAGATSDAVTRIVAEAMGRILKQTVIVENKTGAAGRIANELVIFR